MNEPSLKAKYDTAMEELRRYEEFYEAYRELLQAQDIESTWVTDKIIQFKHPSEFSARISCLANRMLHGMGSEVQEIGGQWYNIVDLQPALDRLPKFVDGVE